MHNYFGWTLSVFIGMQFTHLSRSSFFGSFDFAGNILLYWPLKNWLILFGIFCIIVYTAYDLLVAFAYSGTMIFYVGVLLVIFLVNFVLVQFVFGIDNFHLHHYVLGQMLIFFTCYQEHYIIFLNGIGTGIMLDGGSSFGWDPVY